MWTDLLSVLLVLSKLRNRLGLSITSPLLLPSPAWRGCAAEPPTAWLAATKMVEEAIDLRVGVESMPAPKKKLSFTELKGMVGTALNR
jgi:hypothetical protein